MVEVAKWPKWKRDAYRIIERAPLSDGEYKRQREDSQKYGNY